MVSAGERFVIAFNGEIYNHLDLRRELGSAAPTFRGHSDTETLLAGFEAWGVEETVRSAIGMFAFAVWDRRTCTLTLSRDRMGEKPLYYGWFGDTLLFGSELKALKAHPAFVGRVDRVALAAFMRYSEIPAPLSIWEGVRKLLPASILTIPTATADEARAAQPRLYWSLVDVARRGLADPFAGSDVEAVAALEACLGDAVASQQMSDVPIGAFLSGGVDSSVIVALMQARAARPIHTFTIGFEEAAFSEAPHARAVAAHLGTDHTELVVTSAAAQAVIPCLPTMYDEPFADPSQVPTFLVSQLARTKVTVSLSGDAGDELFGGYNRYSWARKLERVPAPMRRAAARALLVLGPDQWDRAYDRLQPALPRRAHLRMPGYKAHKLAGALRVGPGAALYDQLVSIWADPASIVIGGEAATASGWSAVADLDGIEHQMMAMDACSYLPDDILCKVDRAAMAVSLETRVPFLDRRVIELAWRLPLHLKIRGGTSKWIVREVLYKHVPRALIERPKMGFAIPVGAWLRGPLRDWAEALLDEGRLLREGYLRPGPIRLRWEEHLSGRRDWGYQLWNVLMFQAWLAEYS